MPDNAVYYHAAYIAAAVIYGGYIVSLVIRTRRARERARRREIGGQSGVARRSGAEMVSQSAAASPHVNRENTP